MTKRVLVALLCAGLAVGGCVTAGERSSVGAKQDAGPESALGPQGAVSISEPAATLGETARRIGEQMGGGLVIMSGIENQPSPALDFKNAPLGTVVQKLSADVGCAYHTFPGYFFIYPREYEALLQVSLAGTLDPAFAQKTAALTCGYDTAVFEVLALLSHSLGTTIVADNLIGDARCGGVVLAEIPLTDCLEAVLRSARVPQGAFRVESTPEYTFLFAVNNTSPATPLLNPDNLDAAQNAALDSQVSVVLGASPSRAGRIAIEPGATSLRDELASLSQQLGTTVTAEPGIEDLPVNPCVLNNVRVRTALDLLVRQWPVGTFGYEATASGIVLKQRN